MTQQSREMVIDENYYRGVYGEDTYKTKIAPLLMRMTTGVNELVYSDNQHTILSGETPEHRLMMAVLYGQIAQIATEITPRTPQLEKELNRLRELRVMLVGQACAMGNPAI